MVCPFWFLAIYLLKPELIHNEPVYIPIVISFCISSFSYISSFAFISAFSFEENFKKKFRLQIQYGVSLYLTIIFANMYIVYSYLFGMPLKFAIITTGFVCTFFQIIFLFRLIREFLKLKKNDKSADFISGKELVNKDS